MQFARNYDKEPIVVIAASHNSEGNNLKPIHMSVTAWVEVKYDGNVVKSFIIYILRNTHLKAMS